jgi:hypothetical protein
MRAGMVKHPAEWRHSGYLVPPYGEHFDSENEALRSNNTVPWQTKP